MNLRPGNHGSVVLEVEPGESPSAALAAGLSAVEEAHQDPEFTILARATPTKIDLVTGDVREYLVEVEVR